MVTQLILLINSFLSMLFCFQSSRMLTVESLIAELDALDAGEVLQSRHSPTVNVKEMKDDKLIIEAMVT